MRQCRDFLILAASIGLLQAISACRSYESQEVSETKELVDDSECRKGFAAEADLAISADEDAARWTREYALLYDVAKQNDDPAKQNDDTAEQKSSAMAGREAATGGNAATGAEASLGAAKRFFRLFACPKDAEERLRAGAGLVLLLPGSAASEARMLQTWAAQEFPDSLRVRIRGSCDLAANEGRSACKERFNALPDSEALRLVRSDRFDASFKSSWGALRGHVDRFVGDFNRKLELLYAAGEVKSSGGSSRASTPFREVRRLQDALLDAESAVRLADLYLAAVEQIHPAANAKKPAKGQAKTDASLRLIGVGFGAYALVKALKDSPSDALWGLPNKAAACAGGEPHCSLAGLEALKGSLAIALPGWLPIEQPADPAKVESRVGLFKARDAALHGKLTVANRRSDLRASARSYLEWVFFEELFDEGLSSRDAENFAILGRKDLSQKLLSAMEAGAMDSGAIEDDRSFGIAADPDAFVSDSFERAAAKTPSVIELKRQEDLRGAVEFQYRPPQGWHEAGDEGLFAYGGCGPDFESQQDLLPQAYFFRQNGKLVLRYSLRYQGSEHAVETTKLEGMSETEWNRLSFSWELPTVSIIPKTFSISDIATFLSRSPARQGQQLEILTWILGGDLPTSFRQQRGNGSLHIYLNGAEIAANEIKDERSGEYFRACLASDGSAGLLAKGLTKGEVPSALDASGAESSESAAEASAGNKRKDGKDWHFVRGQICNAYRIRTGLRVGLLCARKNGQAIEGRGSMKEVALIVGPGPQ